MKEIEENDLLDGEVDPDDLYSDSTSIADENHVITDDEGKLLTIKRDAFKPKPLSQLWLLIYNQKEYQLENRDPFSIDDGRLHILREDYYIPDDDLDFPLGIDRRNRQHGFFTTTAEELLGEPYRKLAVVSGFELHHFIVPKETKRLLKLGNRLPSLGWLYGNQSAKVIDEIKVSTVCLNINLLLILHQACDEIVILCFM